MREPPVASIRAASRPQAVGGLVAEVLGWPALRGLSPGRVEGMGTALAEAVANAVVHGNQGDPELDVEVRVALVDEWLLVDVVDHGPGGVPLDEPPPDLRAQVDGRSPLGGWGTVLMRRAVDAVTTHREGGRHVVRLHVAVTIP